MDGNKFLNRLDNLSKSLDLEVAMFSKALSESTIFFGRSSILEDNPLTVDFEVFNSNWKIAFLPADGWDNEFFDIRYIRAILFIIIFIICYLAYNYLSTRKNLRKQAMTDYLTGLYNRNFLDKYFKDVESEVKNSKLYDKLLFVNLDIDKFKDINDNYGHKIGDEVLRSFSRNLQDIPVSNKTILRLGGDEFLAIIKLPIGADVSAIETIIKDRINYVFRLNRITLPIVSSVGFALFPDDSEDIDELISKSDLLMYEDKRRRRN
jgi:diguanylate cyclase (GGDEF)-like protein